MVTFKQFIHESSLKDKMKGPLATAMLSAGAINVTGIPVEQVPGIVHDYWQEKIAPTREQQIATLSAKYQHMAKKHKGQTVLDLDKIPDQTDREKFIKLVTGKIS
jgi:hypothetical protein